MKKFLCLLFVFILLFVTGCKSSADSDTKLNENVKETEVNFIEVIEKELLKEVLSKLSELIDINLYTATNYGEDCVYLRYNGSIENTKQYDNIIKLEDGTVVELGRSTEKDFIDNGFELIPQTVPADGGSFEFQKDGMKLSVSRYNYRKMKITDKIEKINLDFTDEYIGYNYMGITKDATLQSIIDILGTPTSEIIISVYDDTCIIELAYSSSGCKPGVYLRYDKELCDFILYQLILVA